MRTTRSAITLGLLLTATVALSACSQEDYYCDADGCYLCDGVGCRTMGPPSRSGCERGDCDCAAGSVCTSAGCATPCSADADCARGTVCRGGLCLSPRETATAVGACGVCDTCEAPNVCVADVCALPPDPPCASDADCDSPEVCVDGECRSDVCQFTRECGDARVCVNQHCSLECDAARACPIGATCDDGYCVEVPPATACSETSPCGAGQICIDGACWQACGATAACGEGRYCGPDGRCRYDDRPRPTCGEGRPCIAPATCENGVCRSPCETATDCRRFDEQLTFCGDDMLCYTTNEATSNCNDQTDCSGEDRCIDGTCR